MPLDRPENGEQSSGKAIPDDTFSKHDRILVAYSLTQNSPGPVLIAGERICPDLQVPTEFE